MKNKEDCKWNGGKNVYHRKKQLDAITEIRFMIELETATARAMLSNFNL